MSVLSDLKLAELISDLSSDDEDAVICVPSGEEVGVKRENLNSRMGEEIEDISEVEALLAMRAM